MKAALAALAAAGCAHHVAVELPTACKNAAGADACLGWIAELSVIGAGDMRDGDAALEDYVNGVASRIARVAGVPGVHVELVDAADPEAQASGGGIIYVNRGALVRLDDEAELAGLLAHEITHLVARHTADLLHSDEDSAMSDEERLRRRDDDESIADERAIDWMVAAGYDPAAMGEVLRAIERHDDGGLAPAGDQLDLAAPADDHPALAIRLARVERMAAARRGGLRNQAAYLAHVDGTVVGDDPTRGRIDGRTWVRARSRLALDLPRGWTITDTAPLSIKTADGASLVVLPVDRSWEHLVRPMMTGVATIRRAGHAIVVGTTMPSEEAHDDTPKVTIHAGPRGTPTAFVDEGSHATMLSVDGAHARANLFATIAALRVATAAEVAAGAPLHLHLRRAPRAGTVANVAPLVRKDADRGRALDDPTREVAAGDPIKCVE